MASSPIKGAGSNFPEGLIEFHILIDALDCPALGHPATVRAAALGFSVMVSLADLGGNPRP